MTRIATYDDDFVRLLPATAQLLLLGGVVVHPCVQRITLHGSRGLAGGYRGDSDIDLALHVGVRETADRSGLGQLLGQVLTTTLDNWKSTIQLDLAAVFDQSGCGLACFDRTAWEGNLCPTKGVDCLGLYKIQRGFDGFVSGPAVQVQLMYPMLTIWRNP